MMIPALTTLLALALVGGGEPLPGVHFGILAATLPTGSPARGPDASGIGGGLPSSDTTADGATERVEGVPASAKGVAVADPGRRLLIRGATIGAILGAAIGLVGGALIAAIMSGVIRSLP